MASGRVPPLAGAVFAMKTTLSDRLSFYLPIVLMGLLALGSWWLVRSAPPPGGPSGGAARKPTRLHGGRFSTQQFAADGHLTSQIWGQQARHYLQADILEIDQVRTRSQGAQACSPPPRPSAALATAMPLKCSCWGNAKVDATTPMAATDGAGRRVFACLASAGAPGALHLPVTLTRGGSRLPATALEYDNARQVALLQGRVRGHIEAPGARASLAAGRTCRAVGSIKKSLAALFFEVNRCAQSTARA